MLHIIQVNDSARVILHTSDASMYREEKVMPPRSLQAPSEQYVEPSPKCPAAHMTELHIQIRQKRRIPPLFAGTVSELC